MKNKSPINNKPEAANESRLLSGVTECFLFFFSFWTHPQSLPGLKKLLCRGTLTSGEQTNFSKKGGKVLCVWRAAAIISENWIIPTFARQETQPHHHPSLPSPSSSSANKPLRLHNTSLLLCIPPVRRAKWHKSSADEIEKKKKKEPKVQLYGPQAPFMSEPHGPGTLGFKNITEERTVRAHWTKTGGAWILDRTRR